MTSATLNAVVMSASLFDIVEVDYELRIRCQAPGCSKSVFKRIHVVLDGDRVVAVGSDCWAKLYAHVAPRTRRQGLGGDQARLLTPEERNALVNNTAAFVAQREAEIAAAELLLAEEAARAEEARRQLAEQERARWAPPVPDPQDAPYVAPEDRGRSNTAREDNALERYRAAKAAQAAREVVARVPSFRRFPMRWVERAMVRAKADCVARGLKLDEPGSRQAIEDDALALLERHYPGGAA